MKSGFYMVPGSGQRPKVKGPQYSLVYKHNVDQNDEIRDLYSDYQVNSEISMTILV